MTPYGAAARDYLEAGWSPIPLPFKEKAPPPDGYTGAAGTFVTAAEVAGWTRSKPLRAKAGNLSFVAGNIGLRLPPTVLGIDADRYDGKAGTATIAKAEASWGALPDTWTSTSRTDGSGIALYRIPEGLAWPGQVGPGVETLRWDHRFAVVAPSVHPEGREYFWIKPGGVRAEGEIPAEADLAWLPETWIEGLTSGKLWTARAADEMTDGEVRAWLAARKVETCEVMRATLARCQKILRTAGDDGGAHEVARDAAWGVIGDAASGHGGVIEALGKLRRTFLSNVKERRGQGAGEAEWARIVIRGVQKVAAEGSPATGDMCAEFDAGSGGSTTSAKTDSATGPPARGSGAFDYERDDIGNAQRLKAHVGTDARYVAALSSWAIYDPSTGLWSIDVDDGPIRRAAIKVVRGMEAEAAFIEDPKASAAFRSFVRASGSLSRIKAMVEMTRSLRGIAAEADMFDSNPQALVCSNGVVELREDGARFRAIRHEDYATMCTGTEYSAEASSGEWEGFLKRILPDKADRRWVQTLAGYSLYGSNPERVVVIAKGPTTSGKTTFAESLQAALGPLAGPFNLSLFRGKQDEGPRADIIKVLPKRLIVASEASAEWYLHADVMKHFTGGERIAARRLSSNVYVEREPAFTPWLTTNSYPMIPGADKALWRRLKLAPFLISIPEEEQDSGLRGRLQTAEGRAAILAWAVRGWEIYCRDGLRDIPSAAASLAMEAREEMSDLDMCLAQTCEFAGEYREPAIDLFDAYRSWTQTNSDERRMLSLTAWGRSMSAKGYERWRGRADGATDDIKVWYRLGLRLNRSWSRARGN